MGLFTKTLTAAAYASAAAAGGLVVWTRKSSIVPVAANDPIFGSAAYRAFNPERNPATQDVCVRRVPLARIRPDLLEGAEEDGKLVTAFCQGVWGGVGYATQRAYLSRKYESARTAHQLWTRAALVASEYPVGAQITDHFEVVSRSPTSIVVRCGDSPLKAGLRESDGLFEMSATVDQTEGFAEFALKSVLFVGKGRVPQGSAGPMPAWMEVAHRWYAKVWMESAMANVVY